MLRVFRWSVVTMMAVACGGSTPGTRNPWTPYPALVDSPHTYGWLVVECQYNDVTSNPPGLDADVRQFLGLPGAGFGNAVDYFHDVSYNAAAVLATAVVDWVKVPYNYTDVTTSGGRLAGPGKRAQRVKECLEAVPAALLPDLSSFWGVVAVSNAVADGGACYTGQSTLNVNGVDYQLGCVWFDPNSLFTAFAAHELLHGLGLNHSYDDSGGNCGGNPGEYCDPWDIMSALGTYQFTDTNWVVAGLASRAGPGLDAPGLLKMGWLPSANVVSVQWPDDGSELTYTLRALSHPQREGTLALLLNLGGFPEIVGTFTVEYRQGDGWDRGFAEDPRAPPAARLRSGAAVLVHRYDGVGSPVSTLIENGNSGALGVGDKWVGAGTSTGHVRVIAFDQAAGTATVAVGLGAGP